MNPSKTPLRNAPLQSLQLLAGNPTNTKFQAVIPQGMRARPTNVWDTWYAALYIRAAWTNEAASGMIPAQT